MTNDYQQQQSAATQQGVYQSNLQSTGISTVTTTGIFGSVFPGQNINVPFHNQYQATTPITLENQIRELGVVLQELVKEMGKMRKELAKLSLDRECNHKSVEDIMRHMDVYVS